MGKIMTFEELSTWLLTKGLTISCRSELLFERDCHELTLIDEQGRQLRVRGKSFADVQRKVLDFDLPRLRYQIGDDVRAGDVVELHSDGKLRKVRVQSHVAG